MAEVNVAHDSGSKERVALDLAKIILNYAGGKPGTYEQANVLKVYAACLDATRGKSSYNVDGLT